METHTVSKTAKTKGLLTTAHGDLAIAVDEWLTDNHRAEVTKGVKRLLRLRLGKDLSTLVEHHLDDAPLLELAELHDRLEAETEYLEGAGT